MPGCCRTLAHHSQVMVMPRFSAQRSSGPGSLLEVLHVMRFLGVPLTSQFCLQMLEHPRVSGSQLGDGPVAWPPWEDRPAGSHSSAPCGTSVSTCCPSWRFPGLAQPRAAPPRPSLPGFVHMYKGEPVWAAPCPRSWLIIKQKQNSLVMKLDLSRA